MTHCDVTGCNDAGYLGQLEGMLADVRTHLCEHHAAQLMDEGYTFLVRTGPCENHIPTNAAATEGYECREPGEYDPLWECVICDRCRRQFDPVGAR